MAEKVKRKPGLFVTLKKWNAQKSFNDPASPKTPSNTPSSVLTKPTSSSNLGQAPSTAPTINVKRPSNSAFPASSATQAAPIENSASGIKDLVQCPLCLEVLHNPKMLPCQHTFCLACLTVYVADLPIFDCPTCRTRIQVISSTFLKKLPSNVYIDSLLKLVGNNHFESSNGIQENSRNSVVAPESPTGMKSVELFAGGVRCYQCKTVCDNSDVTCCDHCKQSLCRVCWSQHLDDMQTQIKSILKQLDSAASRLEHKIENYKDRCEHLVDQIHLTAEERISAIRESEEKLLHEVSDISKSGDMTGLGLKTTVDEAKSVAVRAMSANGTTNDSDKVKTFINLHQNALRILNDISKWDIERVVFDKDNFCLETDASTPLDAESDDPLPSGAKQNNPLESEESLVLYYRSRNFTPHYTWRKTSRPGGVAVSPWSTNLYICGMDIHSILIVERGQAKIVARLTNDDMLCPVHIAFMKSLGEIYVTDKWKHCVHVFSKDGEYLRAIGQKGSRPGTFRSPEGIATDNANNLIYVVDTGNDRVQVLQPDGKFVDQIGVVAKNQVTNTNSIYHHKETTCTELNSPTSIAVTNDRVIILDSGNRRVKIYNKKDRNKILEFGSLGQRKGQFRQPEVLTVDPMGFILVGDSGNCRVQVFRPTGQLVRVFGGFGTEPGKFGWISGIHVTKQLDVIISDTKNQTVNFM